MQKNFFANGLGPLPVGFQSSPANTFQITDEKGNELISLAPRQEQPFAPQDQAQLAAPTPPAVAQHSAPPPPSPPAATQHSASPPEKKKKGWF